MARRVSDGFELAIVVQLKQVTIGTAGPHPATGCNATAWHFAHVNRIGRPTDADHRPLFAGGVIVFPPQDLGRAVGL